MKTKTDKKRIRFFCDGSGQRPDGKGSGFAWFSEETGKWHRESIEGLSNNEAEYKAVISVLKEVSKNSALEALTDSLLVVSQLKGEYRIRDAKLEKLATEVKTIVAGKKLDLKLTWIPRKENRAGKLL
jgi:ribonuclease HI